MAQAPMPSRASLRVNVRCAVCTLRPNIFSPSVGKAEMLLSSSLSGHRIQPRLSRKLSFLPLSDG